MNTKLLEAQDLISLQKELPQWEIQQLAQSMLEMAKKLWPIAVSSFGDNEDGSIRS